MKLPVNIMGKAAAHIDSEAITVEPREPKRSWMVCIGVGVLVTLVLVISVAMFLTFVKVSEGVSEDQLTRSLLEADIKYHLPQTDQTLDEHLVVTDNEEDITTKDARMIFDYANGFAITKLAGKDGAAKDGVCFVATFNPSTGINKVRENVMNEKRDATVTGEIDEELYIPTNEIFDRTLLSERAAAMCEASQLVSVKKSVAKRKRGIDGGQVNNGPIFPTCEGFHWETRCGFFCKRETVWIPAIQFFGPESLLNWKGGVVGGLKYVTKSVEMNRCALKCYCYGDGPFQTGTWAPTTSPTPPPPTSTTPPPPTSTAPSSLEPCKVGFDNRC